MLNTIPVLLPRYQYVLSKGLAWDVTNIPMLPYNVYQSYQSENVDTVKQLLYGDATSLTGNTRSMLDNPDSSFLEMKCSVTVPKTTFTEDTDWREI